MSDPTDPGGVGAAQAERLSRTTRVGDSGSPVGSPLTIVLSIIAVVVGFLIFRTIDSDGNAAQLPGTEITSPTPAGASTAPGTATTAPGGTTATVAPAGPVRDGATVVVMNAANQSGAAADMTTKLEALGYTMEGEGITDNSETAVETSLVYYNDGAGPAVAAVAQSLAEEMGIAAQPAPDPLPTDDSTGAATVYVLLGTDLAYQELPGEAPATPTQPAIAGPPTTPAG